jgi:hypothetical protein
MTEKKDHFDTYSVFCPLNSDLCPLDKNACESHKHINKHGESNIIEPTGRFSWVVWIY